VQLQLSAPNKLGSAPAGAAIAVAAPSAIAAVNTNLVINNVLSRESIFDETWFYWLCRGQKAAMLAPTKNPA
jgi:hypothetical protein